MKLTSLLVTLIVGFCFSVQSLAYIKPMRRDLKLASQQLIEKQTISDPVAAGTEDLLDDNPSSDSEATTTYLSGEIDVCRNLVVTPGGTTADVAAGNVVVSGTNFFGTAITENLALVENQATATTGVKAFCSVTSIVIPIMDGTGATFDFGSGERLGMKRCMSNDHVVFYTFGGGKSTSAPDLVTSDVDEISKNTVSIPGIDGGTDIELFFVQNFRCLP